MKRVLMTVVACSCLIAAGLAFSSPGLSSIVPVFSGSWTSNEEAVVDAAVAGWTSLLNIPQTLRVTFSLSDLGGSILGETAVTGASSGLPIAAWTTITDDASMPVSWNPNSPAAGQYDVVTIVDHELGHALGIAYQSNLDYYNRVSFVSGNAYVAGYQLYGGANTGDLSHVANPSDLMYPYLSAGARTPPSYEDTSILSLTYGYAASPVALPPAALLFVPGLAFLLAARRSLKKE
jgi:hypothetical protein